MGIGLDWGNNMQPAECLIKCGGGGLSNGVGNSKEGRKEGPLFLRQLASSSGLLDRSESEQRGNAQCSACGRANTVHCLLLTDQRK